ncbi:hypothetical protein AC578_3286 [Pseudocercospora eumusae]|uniref:DUF7918 domain-containing protein n=1 Tax=Pseudocercospora eumusae TaxID=321146 RepID=A0A139HCK2_9PEZI|nr:hypothetical protein AC578_3286 [Pseudocercospora eumusae]
MAITKALPGVVVSVLVNGAALQEYADSEVEDDARTVTRYVEATSGQTFAISCETPSNFEFAGNCISYNIHMDGKRVDSHLVLAKNVHPNGSLGVRKGITLDKDTMRKFCFAKLRTSEGEMHNAPPAASIQNLGSITVEVHHRRMTGRKLKRSWAHPEGRATSLDVVPEKALKGQAVSHSVGFGDPVRHSSSGIYWETRYLDPTETPAATFIFLYRSKDALKSMLILPRTPSPEPMPTPPPLTKRHPNSLSQAEVAEMQKRLQEFESQSSKSKAKVKREQNENSPPRRKTRKSGEVTVIELDDDGNIVNETSMCKSETPDDATQLIDIN